MWAQIEGLFSPSWATFREPQNGRRPRGGKSVKASESIGNAARAVLHVYDDEIVTGEARNFGKSWGEREEEESVQGFVALEAILE